MNKSKENNNILKKLSAFTLAETLIVIGIIGIVASLTIPNLNSTTADKEKITKVKKIYANLTEAYNRAQAVYGPSTKWYSKTNQTFSDKVPSYILEFMKVSKDCGTSTTDGCFSQGREVVDVITGDSMSINPDTEDARKVVLADGTALAIYPVGVIVVNIDPKAKPQHGKNIFVFNYAKMTNPDTGTMVASDSIRYLMVDKYNQGCDLKKALEGDQEASILCMDATGAGVYTAWVLQAGNMDYLKIDDDGNCPNGKELNFDTLSCN